MEAIIQDIRYGFRMLLKNRSFTLIAIFALALGIGANTAIFSVVNAVLLRPLPYNDPARIMTVLHKELGPVAPANFFDFREQQSVFESIAAAQYWTANLTGRDRPEQINGVQLTADMFHLLGVPPATWPHVQRRRRSTRQRARYRPQPSPLAAQVRRRFQHN